MKKVHFNQGRKNGPIMHRRRFETCEDDETQIKAIRSMLKAWEIINESYWESLRVNNLEEEGLNLRLQVQMENQTQLQVCIAYLD